MFSAERWAWAFINAGSFDDVNTGEDGLVALKAMVSAFQGIPGRVSGTCSAAQAEGMIRSALEGVQSRGAELACRTVVLLIRKGFFTHSDALIREIERILEDKKGILRVILESAVPMEPDFQATLERRLQQKTRSRKIRLITQLAPELLGGYRLRIGSESLDCSLRLQLQELAVHLQAAPGGTGTAGGFSW
ncbi:MAG: F0F1 ATP synthase subunit delta [Treponema sp.]|nr:F0F1 ATP synthase subunit delta [Treponema sp.]